MNYSTTYIALVVTILSTLLPKLGVTVGSEELTTTISVILTIGGALWGLIERYRRGDVTLLGVRK